MISDSKKLVLTMDSSARLMEKYMKNLTNHNVIKVKVSFSKDL
jgi:hypothetical protein